LPCFLLPNELFTFASDFSLQSFLFFLKGLLLAGAFWDLLCWKSMQLISEKLRWRRRNLSNSWRSLGGFFTFFLFFVTVLVEERMLVGTFHQHIVIFMFTDFVVDLHEVVSSVGQLPSLAS
jgi:hypothetical protein